MNPCQKLLPLLMIVLWTMSLIADRVHAQHTPLATSLTDDDDEKRMFVMDERRDPAEAMMNEMLDQLRPSLLASPLSEKVNLPTLKLYPLIWQSYLWLTYQLNEECVICGVGEGTDGKAVAVLMLAERRPYKSGEHKWSVEWQPSIGVSGELTFNWTVCSLQSLKEPRTLFRWCESRGIFERVKEVGAPLIQRWLFEANWKQSVGGERTKSDLDLFLHSVPFGSDERPTKPVGIESDNDKKKGTDEPKR